MIITAPVTDYIPASLLTTDGDMIERRTGVIAKSGSSSKGMSTIQMGVGLNRSSRQLIGVLNAYYKGQGGSNFSIFEPLALRDTGIHIGNDTRNAAGAQVITGVGFESSAVIFLATDNVGSNLNWSVGVDGTALHGVLYQGVGGTISDINTGYSIYIDRGGGNSLIGEIDAVGANDFTLGWVLAGACVVDFIYLCLP